MVYLISSFIGFLLMVRIHLNDTRQNVRNDKGVFESNIIQAKGDYMKTLNNKLVQAKTGGRTANFDRLPAGEYAVTVMA